MRWHAAGMALGAIGWATPAWAIAPPTVYDNHQNYPIGGRAASMGGAYTSLACDEAALHYNPAALGCANASRVELAANAYLLQAFDVPDAFGQGNDVDAINFHSLPSVAGGVRILADGDADGSNRWAFGFSVAVPQSLVLRVDPEQTDEPSALTLSVIDNIITGDVGVGWRINRYVSVGASIGGAMRNYDSEVDLMSIGDTPVICNGVAACLPFFQSTTNTRALAVGLRGKAGVRVTPIEGFSLGLALTSPSIDVFGSSSTSTDASTGFGDPTTGQGIFGAGPSRYEGSSNLSMPFRMALGLAYRGGPVTVSLDASLNFPHTVETIHELEQIQVRGFPVASPEELAGAELVHDRTWQPNVNVGAEFAISEPVVLAVGAFTDLSSVSDKARKEDAEDRVHMFGGTLGLGLTGKRARGWFGLSFEMGRADAKVIPGTLDFQDVAALSDNPFTADSHITRWTLAGFIGSNYSFFEGDDDETPPEPKKKKKKR